MKSIYKPVFQTTSSKIALTPTIRRNRKQESAKPPFQNNLHSQISPYQPPTSGNKYSVSAYKCGCEYSTDSIHSFKNHVLDAHRGEFLEGSTHFLSGMTKVVLPCVKNKDQLSWDKNYSNSKAAELKKQKQFLREIWWNGFVLVQNKVIKRVSFYCGHCQIPFSRIIDFVNHCLTDCGQLQNEESSHFIYDETDWKIKEMERLGELKTNQKPIIEQNKASQPLQQLKSNQIGKQAKLQDFHQQILNFTVNYFLISSKMSSICFRQDYNHINDKIIYENMTSLNSQIKYSFKCFACGDIFLTKFNFYKHLYVSGEKQDKRSNLLIFNREIFYQANQENIKKHLSIQKISIQNFRIDWQFLKYLNKKKKLFLKLLTCFRSIKRYSGIIKSFSVGWKNFQLNDQYFRCEACGYITPYHNNRWYYQSVYDHIYKEDGKCFNKNYAFIYLEDWKPSSLRKHVVLNRKSPYLKDEKFICPCQKDIILSKVQFVNHVVKEHQGVVHIKFYSILSKLE